MHKVQLRYRETHRRCRCSRCRWRRSGGRATAGAPEGGVEGRSLRETTSGEESSGVSTRTAASYGTQVCAVCSVAYLQIGPMHVPVVNDECYPLRAVRVARERLKATPVLLQSAGCGPIVPEQNLSARRVCVCGATDPDTGATTAGIRRAFSSPSMPYRM